MITTAEIRSKINELINGIDDVVLLQYLYAVMLRELSLNEVDEEHNEVTGNELREPTVAYGKKEKFVIELPEDFLKDIEEGLEDVRMGRVLTEEQAEAEIDELFEKFDKKNAKS